MGASGLQGWVVTGMASAARPVARDEPEFVTGDPVEGPRHDRRRDRHRPVLLPGFGIIEAKGWIVGWRMDVGQSALDVARQADQRRAENADLRPSTEPIADLEPVAGELGCVVPDPPRSLGRAVDAAHVGGRSRRFHATDLSVDGKRRDGCHRRRP